MASTIFSGNDVKTLNDNLSLNDKAKVLPSNGDPSVSGLAAPLGSVALDYSSGKVFKKIGNLNTDWKELGTGQGGINYILNPDAESSTTGWATYADAAGAQPVDGTGGSPTITWTRSTVSPLRGIADFNFTKDAANRQGQGASYSFTVDNADLGKVLTITANYEILSGTFATGDLTAYIVQDPAGTPVVIQPAGFQIVSLSAGTKGQLSATFQTATNVTSYRLCFHVATTSTSAYSLALDTVTVGPQVALSAPAMSDWIAYTPTITGFGTPTSVSFYSKRVGDSIEVLGKFTSGTSTATQAQVTLGYAGGNANITIDSNKIAATSLVGYATYAQVTASIPTVLASGGNNYLQFGTQDATHQGLTPVNASSFATSGVAISFYAKVPIAGWSSNTVASSDTDTRVISFTGSKSGGNQSVTANVTDMTFSTVSDRAGAWNGSQYVVPVPGDYQISCTVADQSTNAWRDDIYINGVFTKYGSYHASGQYYASSNIVSSLKAGDTISIRCTATTTLSANGQLSINRLSGPAVVQAVETISARYYLAAQVASSTTQPINYATKDWDTHNAVTTGSAWKFTAPVSGKYSVSTVGASGTSSCGVWIYKNGSINMIIGTNSSAAFYPSIGTIQLLAGDFIDIRYDAALNTISTNLTSNAVTIIRIGN